MMSHNFLVKLTMTRIKLHEHPKQNKRYTLRETLILIGYNNVELYVSFVLLLVEVNFT